MSKEAREQACDAFGHINGGQRSDLMNEDPETGTSTELIAFLQELFSQRDGIWRSKLVCTSVRADHPTYDGPNGHSGGNAIDFKQLGDDAAQHLVQDVQACATAKGIGLGGPLQAFAERCGGYSPKSKLFQDNKTNHVHVQVVGY